MVYPVAGIPSDRLYWAPIIWVKIDDAEAVVGVADQALPNPKSLDAVSLPELGQALARGDPFGTLEVGKASVELSAPLTGDVTAVHASLAKDPGRLAGDPFGTWVIRLRMARPEEVAMLLTPAQFAHYHRPRPKPKAKPKKTPAAPRVTPQPPSDPRHATLRLLWFARLRGHRLRGGDDAFGDRDYSGGSYFSWRQRDIAFTSDRSTTGSFDNRYWWRDTRFLRVSAASLSSTTETHTDYGGSWSIEIANDCPYLVLADTQRGMLRFKLEEGRGDGVLLDRRPYTSSRA